MAWLHENREEFRNAVNFAAGEIGYQPAIIEKDYYVTLILKGLAGRLPYIVFKGGTSLSKCHRVIERFSEDIDITTDERIGDSQKKNVKKAVKEIAEDLGLMILNIGETRSRRNYNRYLIAYETVTGRLNEAIQPMVILETSYAETSFPNVVMPVYSYIGTVLQAEEPDAAATFGLRPFEMKVQGIERTLIDKVFAICDYQMAGGIKRHSRHIYDIYKLLPLVSMDENFGELVRKVRLLRAKNVTICPSAQPGVNVPQILKNIVENRIYKTDYESVTTKILKERIAYDEIMEAIKKIMVSGMFDDGGTMRQN